MKTHCDIVKDLLPLYADGACSEESMKLVEEHLEECEECSRMLAMLKDNKIEDDLRLERSNVLEYGAREFRRQTARAGGTVSGVFLIPIIACLALNFVASGGMGWFFIVIASLLVAASLILVPIFVRRNKLFWMFCSFTASLMILLRVISLATHGHWFWIASSASLFGLFTVFLPFLINAEPLRPFTEGCNKVATVIAVDVALFLLMMTAINVTLNYGRIALVLGLACVAGIIVAGAEIFRRRR